MASRTIVELVDDVSGGPADESVSFGLDGREYEIDLSTANAKKLRSALETYQAVARRIGSRPVGRPRGRGNLTAATGDAAEIREWAVTNGFEVSSRGRIPAQLREAYEAR
jgi:Lsr2